MKHIILVLLMMLAVPAYANQAWLQSSEGYQINVYYNIKYENLSGNKPLENWTFSNIRIDVQNGIFSPTDQVQVVFINKLFKNGQCGLESGQFHEIYRKNLKPAAFGVFQGEMTRQVEVRNMMTGQFMHANSLTINAAVRGYCYSIDNLGQELAIVVNGRWLTDPVTGSHNFKLNLR